MTFATLGTKRELKGDFGDFWVPKGDISHPSGISAIPIAYQLSQQHVSCPKRISAVPRACQLSPEHISYPRIISIIQDDHKSRSSIPRAHPKIISAIPRPYQLSRKHISCSQSMYQPPHVHASKQVLLKYLHHCWWAPSLG